MSTYKKRLRSYKKLLIDTIRLRDQISTLQQDNIQLQQDNIRLRLEIQSKDEIIRGMQEVANRDSLTNALNRRGIYSKLNEVGEIPYSLIMCDIDDFKTINDRFGHQVGDKTIQFISKILETAVREEDYVARIGGDEMIILLSGCREIDAKKKCEEISRTISESELFDFPITLSFGIAYRDPTMTYDETRELADRALYSSKRNGKNRATIYGIQIEKGKEKVRS